MTLVIRSGGASGFVEWHASFREFAPDLDVREWDDPSIDPEAVSYVMVWEPDHGRIASYPNLKLICSAAAGIDHILADPTLPRHLPLVRLVTTDQAQRMGDYICWAALSLMRRIPEILAQNKLRGFDNALTGESAPETRVGVMGLGVMGARAAEMLAGLGFQTAGWSNTPKQIAGVASFAGVDALPEFLARTDILVCLLPLTPETTGIINAKTLAQLPKGAGVINAGRGPHVVDADLLAALESGHLAGAVLDVFSPEPLPPENPYWSHPKVIVTPHVASFGSRRVRARHIANVIAAFNRGEPYPGLYDPVRGY